MVISALPVERIFRSAAETQTYAGELAGSLSPGTVIALIGNLGTGKTTFVQGFARGMGIKERVGSPTFKIVSEYAGPAVWLYHVDCYRLAGPADFLDIGGETYLFPEHGNTLIEWAERIQTLLPGDALIINFDRIPGEPDSRKVKIARWPGAYPGS